MSSLITNPTPQFINPFFGTICENAKIYIGRVNTDGLLLDNRQSVYLMQWSDEATVNKVPLPQPLETNSAGCIVYQGLPVTPWVDGAYSITVIGYDGALLYQSFYVDDPTYWLRLDLATEPARTADGLHYNPDDEHGVNMVGGAAPILSPDFQGEPTSPTPPAGDSSTRHATTEFVTEAVASVAGSGTIGVSAMWNGSVAPANAVVEDGSALSKQAYPELYAIIGDTVALENGLTPDSSTFFISDSRSRYWRGTDYGAARSVNAEMLKYYDDMFKEHNHQWLAGYLNVSVDDTTSLLGRSEGGSNDYQTNDVSGRPWISNSGGTETMPKTVAKLPILWVSDGAASVATTLWWEQSQYLQSRPHVHHYHHETGELLGSSPARPSPREPGVWLTPALATRQIPPGVVPGHILRFTDGQWCHDAQIFSERLAAKQQAQLEEKQQREAANILINKRDLMNKWLRENGAPYSLDELEGKNQ